MNLTDLAWPLDRLHEALMELAWQNELTAVTDNPASIPDALTDDIGRWLEHTAVSLNIEAEPAEIPYPDLVDFLQTAGPALCQLPSVETPRFLALMPSKGGQLKLLAPDLTSHKQPVEAVRAALSHALEAPLLPEIQQLLQEAGVAKRRQSKAQSAMLTERLSQTRIGSCWRLEASPGSNFGRQLKLAKVPRRLALFSSGHGLQYGLLLLSWWLLGRAVFQGRLEPGLLLAWGLLLLSTIPLRLFMAWQQTMLAVSVGGLIQKRLLFGVLRLHPDEIRHLGIGQLMGRVYESEAVEDIVVSGGLLTLQATIELLFSFWVLSVGANGLSLVLLLMGWCGVLTGLGVHYFRRIRSWTAVRRELTHDLIEQMVGQRTRLAQLPPEKWHDGEDEMVAHYVDRSLAVDRASARFAAVSTQGWLVIAMIGLLPAFISAQTAPEALAVSIGGILSATLALRRLANGAAHLMTTAVAWEQIAPLFESATRPQPGGSSAALSVKRETAVPVVRADNISFAYKSDSGPVLNGCELNIAPHDRILLEGESGGGKSTLISLLTGLRQPDNGLLLLNGLDWPTMGHAVWQQHVTAAPQFHENHVMGNTFIFNLLMSRGWPPQPGDAQLAYQLCQELGLGELIERMPGGLLQMVGEIGWQLSHGERSRLFIARALLQGADLVILDESFAALDPKTLQCTMACVRKHASALLVIAHP